MQPSNDQPADRRVTVVEAAAILGVTPDAVRSRLRRGTLQRDEAPDGTVLVVLAAENTDGRDRHGDQSTDRATDQTTVAYINGLTSKIELLERELTDWKEEARRKDHLLAAALERIPAIEAAEPRESDLTASTGPESSTGSQEQQGSKSEPEQRRSWLYKFFVGS